MSSYTKYTVHTKKRKSAQKEKERKTIFPGGKWETDWAILHGEGPFTTSLSAGASSSPAHSD